MVQISDPTISTDITITCSLLQAKNRDTFSKLSHLLNDWNKNIPTKSVKLNILVLV